MSVLCQNPVFIDYSGMSSYSDTSLYWLCCRTFQLSVTTQVLILIEMINSTTPTQCCLLMDLSHLLLEYTNKVVYM